MRVRLLSGALLVPPVVIMLVAGGPWIALLTLIIGGVALIEYVHLVARRGHRAFGGLMLLWMLVFVLDRSQPGYPYTDAALAALLVVTLSWALMRYRQGTVNAFTGFAMTLAGAYYIGWSGAHLVSLRSLPDGLFWTMIVFPSIWSADTSAYFFGRAFGRVKLVPDVSPGKTWEGYLGAVILTPLIVAGLALLWRWLGAGEALTPAHAFMIGFLIAAIAPVGDLGMSMLKRYANAKDSSNLLPGHGGFLDRIDSTLIAILLGYYYLTLFVL
jgi:phosphatidate cytidylyltransferase